MSKKCAGFRCTGSAAIDLSLVASGKTDAFYQRIKIRFVIKF